MAMVQQPQSAKYAGMPSSAINTGLADYVLPPSAMPQHLVAYAKGPYLASAQAEQTLPTIPIEPIQKIFVLLRTRTGHDFSAYKTNTIRRRIERRMNVHQIKKPNQYVRYLQENPQEIDILFKELLITVTNFFRDPEAWEVLQPYLDDLVKSRPEDYVLRVWIPGCATGEEAYSLAIMLREAMEASKKYFDVQIFGTDLDAEAIDTARAGQYPDGIASDIPAKRLDRYFVRDEGTYRIRKEIREMVVFAPQNVIKDPPFTKLDVISCRNLLIYLNTELQKRLLPIFHYALKADGLLFLGPSESVGSFIELFEPLDKRWKLFRRMESATATGVLPAIPAQPLSPDKANMIAPTAAPAIKDAHLSSVIERLLLGRFAPPSVIASERGDILYIHGRTGAYFEPAQGEPRNNLLDMAREGLQIELSSAMRECAKKGIEVVRNNIRVKTNGDYAHVTLNVTKIKEPETIRGLLLVTFRPTPPPPKPSRSKGPPKTAGADDRIEQLERELQALFLCEQGC